MPNDATGSVRWTELLRHTIGIDKDVSLIGTPWRNHFAASVGEADEREFLRLVDYGLAKAGRTINDGTMRYFHATDDGIRRVRADEEDRRKAAGLRRWIVSYPLDDEGMRSTVVLAKSRAAARWDVALNMMDVGADKMWCFRNIRAHVMTPLRLGSGLA